MEDVGRLRMMEDGRMIAKKSISCMRVLCIYRTLLAAQKRIRTAILSTDHSLFTLGYEPGSRSSIDFYLSYFFIILSLFPT